ncbi:MAG TPA: prolyl oligopeptidase family serine peptidase [Ignavibacteriaceae bacterium]|nr:prolyl oligopeptidase family serine peptidase [Ignavibacteriaceae bacterium]
MKILFLIILCLTIGVNTYSQQINYPKTKKVNQVDDYHGTKVSDPYRWLEDDNAPEVKKWVEEQNKVTFDYLSKIPYRNKIKERIQKLWNYPKYGLPQKEGNNYFFSKNDGLQNQSVVYIQNDLNAQPEVFLDPNKLSEDGTVALSGYNVSKDGKYFVYGAASAGSDWNDFYVMEVATKKKLNDHLKWLKFSGIAFEGDGFYYSRYPEPKGASTLTSKNEFHKIYFHKIGDDQSKDKLVYEDNSKPTRYFNAQTTEDQRFLIIYYSDGTSFNGLLVKDLSKPKSEFIPLVIKLENNYSVVDNIGDKLLVMTDKGASRYRLVLLDPNKPESENWKEVLPEEKGVLENVVLAGGKLFASYLEDASNHLYQYNMDGSGKTEIKLPAIGTVVSISGKKEENVLFYSFNSFTFPTTIYKYDIKEEASEVYNKPEVDFNLDNYETKQVFYASKDGTKIPMFIVHKKGLKMDGNNPTYLYAYGGFNASMNPSFSVSRLIFLENGGVYAMPNLRGGGEYGEEWHKAGMLENKQNVFDDFIAAAEYLIKEKYTSSQKLAVSGGSNGGLLIGAVVNQRPDLFKVALPAVGVMDMLRYHKFTIGWGWVVEYGSSDNPEQFKYIYKYSPLHNIKDAEYPATLVTTADHDDRVVPAHSFKYIATLQEHQKGNNPVLIRIETKAGHGGGKPTSKIIEEAADIWSFVFYNLGVKVIY